MLRRSGEAALAMWRVGDVSSMNSFWCGIDVSGETVVPGDDGNRTGYSPQYADGYIAGLWQRGDGHDHERLRH